MSGVATSFEKLLILALTASDGDVWPSIGRVELDQ